MKSGLMFAAFTVIGAVSFVSAAALAQNAAGVPTNGIAAASALPQTPLKRVVKQGTVSNEPTPPSAPGQAALPPTPAPLVANTAK
jgi:hypothetical protein